jgi:type I restriction enzyme R subunit
LAVPISSERVIVQKPFIRYAEEAGWQPLSPEEALRLRRGESSPLLFDIFVRKIQELNPGKVDHLKAEDLVKLLARVPSSIEGNLQAWEYLRGLKTVLTAQNLKASSSAISPQHFSACQPNPTTSPATGHSMDICGSPKANGDCRNS